MLRENVHAQYFFKRPLFKFQEAALQFFEMIYDVLGVRLNIQPNELSAAPANNFAEARARYSVYGGSSSVSLLADRIAFDFPGLVSSDLGIMHEIMATVYDNFPSAFPDVSPARIEAQEYAHLDIGTQEAVAAFLNKYRVSTVEKTFGDDLAVINTPSVRYSIVAQDGSWKSVVSTEISQLSTTALFGTISTSLLKLPDRLDFVSTLGRFQTITLRALASLDLEPENAAG